MAIERVGDQPAQGPPLTIRPAPQNTPLAEEIQPQAPESIAPQVQTEPEEMPDEERSALDSAAPQRSTAPSVKDMLDMLDEREAEKKGPLKSAAEKPPATGKAKSKGKAKAKPKAKAKGKVAAKPKAKAAGAPPASAAARPMWSYEWTRSQIMCRTGLKGPGQNHGIRWGPACDCKTSEDAKKRAEAWLKGELKKRKLS